MMKPFGEAKASWLEKGGKINKQETITIKTKEVVIPLSFFKKGK